MKMKKFVVVVAAVVAVAKFNFHENDKFAFLYFLVI
jgi:hypothetical protein